MSGVHQLLMAAPSGHFKHGAHPQVPKNVENMEAGGGGGVATFLVSSLASAVVQKAAHLPHGSPNRPQGAVTEKQLKLVHTEGNTKLGSIRDIISGPNGTAQCLLGMKAASVMRHRIIESCRQAQG